MSTPLVSICCLTYNHAPFIRNCIDGFIAQQTDFPIEILVHDDASTDGTDGIVREYADKYPEIIFPLFEEENQYSRGYAGKMDIEFNYSRARGKYIAYCEGDDYWTDPSKLQRQVDFMEAHPDYSVCFHRCKRLDNCTGKMYNDECWHVLSQGQEGVDITVEMFFKSWITQPLTMVFRRDKFDFGWQKRYHYYRDIVCTLAELHPKSHKKNIVRYRFRWIESFIIRLIIRKHVVFMEQRFRLVSMYILIRISGRLYIIHY